MASLVACSLSACDEPDPPAPPPLPEVVVEEPVVRDVPEFLFYTGTLEAVDTAEIRARVPGFLREIHFNESTQVTRGDVLFSIEPDSYEIAVREARASKERVQAQRDAAESRLRRVKEAQQRQAATELEVIEQQAEVDRLSAEIRLAAAALDEAELQLSYTEVTSPIAGRVDRNYVDVGNLVGDGERTLLATVVTMQPMHCYFDVSERIALRYIEQGDRGNLQEQEPIPARLGLMNEEGYPHEGQIDYVANEVDASTGTIVVRASFPNLDRTLFPGLFARVRVPFQHIEGAVLVHENAIANDLGGRFLWVVDAQNIPSRRGVELGGTYEGGFVLVTSGLQAGERYVTKGIQRVRPGMPVNAKVAGQTPAPASGG